MTSRFEPDKDLVVVRSELYGPAGNTIVRLAVDTGATMTLLNVTPLKLVGHDPSSSSARIEVTTGSGVEHVPCVSVNSIKAMGHERTNFPVLAHTLPLSAGVDGVIGLDYMQARILRIDFRRSLISLT